MAGKKTGEKKKRKIRFPSFRKKKGNVHVYHPNDPRKSGKWFNQPTIRF